MGIENFLRVVPLFDENDNLKVIESRKWLLPILRKAGRNHPSELSYFVSTIHASISNYDKEIRIKLLQQEERQRQARGGNQHARARHWQGHRRRR